MCRMILLRGIYDFMGCQKNRIDLRYFYGLIDMPEKHDYTSLSLQLSRVNPASSFQISRPLRSIKERTSLLVAITRIPLGLA